MTEKPLISPAEARVLDALIEHGKDKLVARALGMGKRGVEMHLYNIRKKLTLTSTMTERITRVRLMRWWMERQEVAQ